MSDTTHDGGVALGTPPSADEGLGAAQLAAKYGLTVSGARPGLLAYMRQLWGRRQPRCPDPHGCADPGPVPSSRG